MLNLGKSHEKIRVVNDQIGTPTYTLDLARLLVDMAETERYGYYHATNEGGYISWYDFTTEIFRQAAELGHPEYGADHITVVPVTTAEYGVSRAKRPFNSRLDKSKLTENGFTPLPAWQDALNRYLERSFINAFHNICSVICAKETAGDAAKSVPACVRSNAGYTGRDVLQHPRSSRSAIFI